MLHLQRAAVIAASSLAILANPAAKAALVTVNVDYDLTVGSALQVDYDAVNGLDWFASGPIGIGNVVLANNDQLRVNVTFRDATTSASQVVVLHQMGLGGAERAPATFGSPSRPAGEHFFGPSVLLLGSAMLAGLTITPTIALGSLADSNPPYSGVAPTDGVLLSCPVTGVFCEYPTIFPDMIEGNEAIGLSGFSALFGTQGSFGGTADALQFYLIAPAITIPGGPSAVSEPTTPALLVAALLSAFSLTRLRRARSTQYGHSARS